MFTLSFSYLSLEAHIIKPLADKVLSYRPDSETTISNFPPDIAEAIHQLWKDPIITKIMDEHSSDFYLMDSAA
jgi:guanine nucleotide-binding protein subunit alpha